MRRFRYFILAAMPFVVAGASSASSIAFTYTGSNYGPGLASIPTQTLSGISVSEIGVWANVDNSGAVVTGTSNDFAATDIAEYAGDGIGVCNPSEQAAGCVSPQHQIDNYQGMDFALFSFSAAVSLNDVYVAGFGNPEGPPTQTYNDVDLSYSILTASQVTALNNGTLPFSALTFTTFNTNFYPSYDYSLTGTGQYILIGAAVTPYYGDGSASQATPDAFKIQTLTVNAATATPEPASWFLIGSGLLSGLFLCLAENRTKAPDPPLARAGNLAIADDKSSERHGDMTHLDNQLAEDYLKECRDRLAGIRKDLLAIESAGADFDEGLLGRVILALHSVEAGGALFDLGKIGEVARPMEEVLGFMRARAIAPTPERIGVLLHAIGQLHEMIQSREAVGRANIAGPVARLATLLPEHRPGSPVSRANSDKGNLRILLVEDDFASRLLLQTFLGHYGECQIAVNGREAVDAFRSSLEEGERYDLICMDIMMPEMDGREAVREIRTLEESMGIRSTAGAKIVMTTTISDIKEVSRCFSDLCDGYLVKPIDLAKLLGQMRAYNLVR